ncbi:hypothetical protein BX616_002604 [Lobosporangium transversale]|nr:hypothetical protein BX616_002604 [Lobosporangium transversale]
MKPWRPSKAKLVRKKHNYNSRLLSLPPEVMERIFSYVSQSNLRFTISLVCRQWHQIAQALIKRTAIVSVIHLSCKLPTTVQGKKLNRRQQRRQQQRQQQEEDYLEQKLMAAYTLVYEAGLLARPYLPRLAQGEEDCIWIYLKNALTAAVSKTVPGGLKIQQLILDADLEVSVWSRLVQLLGFLRPRLSKIHLYNIPYSTVVPVDEILEQCPNLQELCIMSKSDPSKENMSRLKEPHGEADDDNCINGPSVGINLYHKLRSATFSNMVLSQTATEVFVQACPNLLELRIINCQPLTDNWLIPDNAQNFLFVEWRRVQFFELLASCCPKFVSLHVSLSSYLRGNMYEEVAPIQQFPRVEHWGVSTFCMLSKPSASAFVLLDRHRLENRLTTIEITGKSFNSNSAINANRKIGNWMHWILCECPLLEHFKAQNTSFPLDILYVTKALSVKPERQLIFDDEYYTRNQFVVGHRVWACRRLKTLYLRIDVVDEYKMRNYEEQSRVIYGYISRVCPYLEELSIHRNNIRFRPPISLCLLSRLRAMKVLHLRDTTRSEEQDIDWMKRYYYYDTREQMKQKLIHGLNNDDNNSNERSLSMTKSLKRLWGTASINVTPVNIHDSISMAEQGFMESMKCLSADTIGYTGVVMKGEEEEKKREDEIESIEEEVVDGVDMTHLGQPQDVLNYFKERRANRNECLWPDLETIHLPCFGPDMRDIIKKVRPEVEVIYNGANQQEE